MTDAPRQDAPDAQPMQWRKKPVVITAIRYTGDNLLNVLAFTGKSPRFSEWFASDAEYVAHVEADRRAFKIFTLEGVMEAMPGDYVIRGVRGEHYPCKPDIFAEIHEPAVPPRRERVPSEVEDGQICPRCGGYGWTRRHKESCAPVLAPHAPEPGTEECNECGGLRYVYGGDDGGQPCPGCDATGRMRKGSSLVVAEARAVMPEMERQEREAATAVLHEAERNYTELVEALQLVAKERGLTDEEIAEAGDDATADEYVRALFPATPPQRAGVTEPTEADVLRVLDKRIWCGDRECHGAPTCMTCLRDILAASRVAQGAS